MAGQPGPAFLAVGAQRVEDHMDLLILGVLPDQLVQEVEELDSSAASSEATGHAGGFPAVTGPAVGTHV